MDSLDRVTLQIGDRKFDTIVGTLTHRSDYFRAFFSGKFTINKQDDGSIFVDANPVLFEHILDYLRRGVFPLEFDKAKGHDYALYTKLLEEARYFQCPALITWLEDSCYEKCVSWRITRTEVGELEQVCQVSGSTHISKPITAVTDIDKVYLCPRGIDRHRGEPNSCGYRCRNALGDDEPEYATEYTTATWLLTAKLLTFHKGWMTDSAKDFVSYLGSKQAGRS